MTRKERERKGGNRRKTRKEYEKKNKTKTEKRRKEERTTGTEQFKTENYKQKMIITSPRACFSVRSLSSVAAILLSLVAMASSASRLKVSRRACSAFAASSRSSAI